MAERTLVGNWNLFKGSLTEDGQAKVKNSTLPD